MHIAPLNVAEENRPFISFLFREFLFITRDHMLGNVRGVRHKKMDAHRAMNCTLMYLYISLFLFPLFSSIFSFHFHCDEL